MTLTHLVDRVGKVFDNRMTIVNGNWAETTRASAQLPAMVMVTQVVECLTVTQVVAGSIPAHHPKVYKTFLMRRYAAT